MITYVHGNLFTTPAKVLVNTVNTVGHMGKGIAKEFRRQYPDMYEKYQMHCKSGKLQTGMLWLYRTPTKWILNFPTKRHWRGSSKTEYIEQGLEKFVTTYEKEGISSVAFPMLGCGHGGLDWDSQVRPLMEKTLGGLPLDVFIYIPPDVGKADYTLDKKTISRYLHQEPAIVPSDVMLADLINLLSTGSTFSDIGTQGDHKCTVQEHDGPVGISFEQSGIKHFVTKGQIESVWSRAVRFGFAVDYMLDDETDAVGRMLVSLMSHLPYVKKVRMAHSYHDLLQDSWGLQIISPPNAVKQLRFEMSPVVLS